MESIVYPLRIDPQRWHKLTELAEASSRSRAALIRRLIDLATLRDGYVRVEADLDQIREVAR